MKEILNNLNKSRKFFIFEICCMLVFSFILLGFNYDMLIDGAFHYRRIDDIYSNIVKGDVFKFVSDDSLHGLGYASTGFYPSLLLIPFACLRILLPSQICLLFYMFFIEFLIALNSYIFIKQLTDNKNKQFVFILIYLILWPVIYFEFYMLALGMITAYALLPLILAGFIKILKGEKYGVLLLSGGMTLLVHSHLIFSLITVIILTALFFINIKEFVKSPKKILNIIISAAICILCGAVVIFPVFEQLIIGENLNIKWIKSRYIEFPANNLLFVLMVFLTGFIFYKSKNKKKTIYLLVVFWVLLSSTNIFPWVLAPKLLEIIQYTTRLQLFISIPLGLYVIECDNKKIEKKVTDIRLYSWVVILFLFFFMSYCKYMGDNNMIEERLHDFNLCIGLGDYLPENFFEDCDKEIYGIESEDDKGVINGIMYGKIKLFDNEYAFSLNNKLNYEIIDNNNFEFSHNTNNSIMLPKWYYKGYTVTLNGKEIDYYQGRYGLLTIDTSVPSGSVSVNYTGTMVQNISKIISYISLLLFGFYAVILLIMKNKNNGYIFYERKEITHE